MTLSFGLVAFAQAKQLVSNLQPKNFKTSHSELLQVGHCIPPAPLLSSWLFPWTSSMIIRQAVMSGELGLLYAHGVSILVFLSLTRNQPTALLPLLHAVDKGEFHA